jgi:hypothetical protein
VDFWSSYFRCNRCADSVDQQINRLLPTVFQEYEMKKTESRFTTMVDSAFVGIGMACLFIGTVVAPSSLAFGDWNPFASCVNSCAVCDDVWNSSGGYYTCEGTCDITSPECDDCTSLCHNTGTGQNPECIRCGFENP